MRTLLAHAKLIAGIAVVVALAVVALRPRPVAVEVAPATRGSLETTIDEEGETRVRHRFVVSAPVTGQVLRIELEPGDRVEAGAAVATIRPSPAGLLDARQREEAAARVEAATAAVGRARAERQRAQAALDHAAGELQRTRDLVDAGVIPTQELDTRESARRIAEQDRKAAEFAVKAAEEDLRLARARLRGGGASASGAPVTVNAPASGVVLRRLRESEAVVAVGEPLLEIGNPADLEIVADLLSTDAVRVSPGDTVRIDEWGGPQPLTGVVRRVEPSGFTKISALGVEEQRVNVIIDFADPAEPWQRLGDGYRVEVRVVTGRKDEVLKVPASALFRHEGRAAVFVADGRRAKLQPVETGLSTGLETEIVGGLDAGVRVIVHPPDRLEDGASIEVR